jgi:trigger factor
MVLSLVGCNNEPKLTKASNGVEIPPYTGLDVVKNDYVITEEFIDYQLAEIAKQYSSLKTVKNGVVQAGDIINVTYKSYVGEQLLEDASYENFEITLGTRSNLKAFDDAIIGLKIGEEFEFAIEYPMGSTYSILDGKTVIHKGTVNYVSKIVYPEITDDFVVKHVAKSYSKAEVQCKTVAEYREYLRERYTFVYNAAAREDLMFKILDKLMETAIFPEIAEEELQAYEDGKFAYYEDYCSSNGFSMEVYLKSQEITEEEFRESLRKDGELVIKQTMLLQAIEELEGIKLTDARYEKYLEYLTEYYQFDNIEQLKEYIEYLDSEDVIRSDARYEAIYDFLIENQNITTEKVDLLEKAKAGELE